MKENLLDERLILLNLQAKNKKEVIEKLSERLLKYGYVKKGYIKAVLKREEESPTGLPTQIYTALPHTDAEYSLRTGIAIATLKKPVLFQEMGNLQKSLEVRMVFLLALNNPKKEVFLLKQILQILHNKKQIEQVLCTQDLSKVNKILSKLFEKSLFSI